MSIFGILFIIFFWILVLIFLLVKSRGNVLIPSFLFLSMAFIDVFIPSIFACWYGFFKLPSWANDLSLSSIFKGLIFYSIFLLIFIVSTFIGTSKLGNSGQLNLRFSKKIDNLILIHLLLLLGLSIYVLYLSISSSGGVFEYLLKSAILSGNSSDQDVNVANNSFLANLPISGLFQAFVGIGFYFRKFTKYRNLYCFVFPLFAFFFAITTLLRGSLIYVIVVLIFAEIARNNENIIHLKFKYFFKHKKVISFTFFCLLIFIGVFSMFRDLYRKEASGSDDSDLIVSITPNFLKQGSGLMGVSSIVENYGTKIDFLYGKTYYDMLLLPVPRSLYKSKPNWYGIDDITRGLGWPDSTQSAVTMPGEAFANFGYVGLFIAIPFGLFFGILDRILKKNIHLFVLIGPMFYFQMFTVTNWMSFTGLVNSLMQIIFICFYFFIFFQSKAIKKLV